MSRNDNGIYNKFEESQKNTWDSIKHENIKTYWFSGNHSKNEIIGDKIYLNVEETDDTLDMTLRKTILALEILKENKIEYDYILRTTVASYIDKNIAYDFISDKPLDNFYGGPVNGNYVEGMGIFLSKDLVELILLNKQEIYDMKLLDDCAFGLFLQKRKVTPFNIDKIDIIGYSYNIYNIPIDRFLYRLKHIDYRWVDILNMYFIHQRKINKI